MSYEVIGHEALRERLRGCEGSFAVLGPPGVGKSGIVAEWAAEDDYVDYLSLPLEAARHLARLSYASPGLTVLLDGDGVQNWNPLLKPIEDGALRVAVYASSVILPAASRMMVFHAGYLSEADVLKVLAKTFPTFGPRPWIAKALKGSFADFKEVYAAVQVFEGIDTCLADRSFPAALKDNPVAVFHCVRLACATRLGSPSLPWSSAALASIPKDVAWQVIRAPLPSGKNEARNLVTMFFSGVTGGRLG